MARCFISYSWDSNEHRDWVRQLGCDLVDNGVDVLLDQWDVVPGDDLAAYMETSIRESDCVLLICTLAFARKANEGHGGVGYEKTIVTGELFQSTSAGKFVPILRAGEPSELPSYLRSRRFLDFRIDESYGVALEELLRHIHRTPLYERPKIGKVPNFASPTAFPSKGLPKHSIIKPFCTYCGAQAGSATKCPGRSFHTFVGGSGTEYCTYCGTQPGSATKCPGRSFHTFVKGSGREYCTYCGAQTGSATKCPGRSFHTFIAG